MTEMRIDGASPLPGPDAEDGSPSLESTIESVRAHVAAVRRYKWLVFLVAALVVGGGAVHTYFQPRVYQAQALLGFERGASGAFDAAVGQDITQTFLNGEMTYLRGVGF